MSTSIYSHCQQLTKLIGGILLSAIALTSCTTQRPTFILSSGADGGAYQRIGKQIVNSAREVGKMSIHDNYNSEGSVENLERLLNKETDLALVQLDVASEAMKTGKVQAIAVLANEYLHLITPSDSEIKTFSDLEGKRVAFGTPRSGIYFTAKRLFNATNLKIIEEELGFRQGFSKLKQKEIDALVYVGPLGGSKKVKAQLITPPTLKLVPMTTSFINYLTIQFPESYQSAIFPKGSYMPLSPIPGKDLPTISTAAALVTRPDVSRKKIALLTWSIISSSRKYSLFYPELAHGDAKSLLRNGLLYLHPGAQQAFDQGDPREFWVRYFEENQDLQAGLIVVIFTGFIGFVLRMWRQKKCRKLIRNSRLALDEINLCVETNPTQAIKEVEELRQQHRLMLVEGNLPREAYEKLEDMTQDIAERSRKFQEKQRRKDIQNTISLIDDCQNISEGCQQQMREKLKNSEQKYREMLLSNQIDIQTYIHLTQLIRSYINFNNDNNNNHQNDNNNFPISLGDH
ncbi:MAG: TAXI family TRAP transporter solute-binding subunit [Okeania sp. SIO3I5]|uniref:TAXI family TRAP transporter solute-binding subunit n=1 Tax=Okeania sp. SIO3I5 TaxID=2607805 RepID=UPI0013BDEE05|nr:TAXI family TRAP transporter solute-binding subunit [Okeania sp. SIO3I5]NEQ41690.1 TAXI family TRAP transporter solute-binding subunit [Okeania sp. SIO3I5]